MVQVNPEDGFTLTFSKIGPQVENTGSLYKVLAHSQIPTARLHFYLCLASFWLLPEHILSAGVCDLIYLSGYICVILSESLQYTFYSLERLKEGVAQYSIAAVCNGWVQHVTLQRGNSH